MSACGVVTAGLPASCKPSAKGLKPKLVLINFEELASVVRHGTKKKFITSLGLAAGKTGYLFEGKQGTDSSNAGRSKLVVNKFSNSYAHEIDLAAFAGDAEEQAAMLARLEELGLSRVVGVIPDNNGGYRVYGTSGGLTLTKDEGNSEDADTGGGHQATLASAYEAGHYDLLAVYTADATPVYDPIATRAAFEALYAA